MIVHPDHIKEAEVIFQDLHLNIVTGHRFLGGFIGSYDDIQSWLMAKIDTWVQSVKKLSNVAKMEPHAAFIALSKSVQNEWLFVQRVVADSAFAFIPLQEVT